MGMSFTKKSQRMVEVYGICGPKGVGKDTLANLICAAVRTRPFLIRPFAGPLKSQVARIFPVTQESLDDRGLKETVFPIPVRMDDYLERMRAETGLSIQVRGKTAHSRRELMQFYGTDYVRSAQADYWMQLWHASLHGQTRVIVPDVRFPNELEQVQALGGKVIRLSRPDLSAHGHESETALAQIPVDLELHIVPGDTSLLKRVARLITLGKFGNAFVYHWPSVEAAIRAYSTGESLEQSAKLLGVTHKDPHTLKNILSYYSVPIRVGGGSEHTRVPHESVAGVICKACCTCKEKLPLTDFNASVKTWDGLASQCRKCAAAHHKAKYLQYEKRLDWNRWLRTVNANAARRGIRCDLTVDDIRALYDRQQGRCWYSGRPLSFTQGDPDRVSLDRVDSAGHYTTNNVVLCSVVINKMKQHLSVAEFHLRVTEVAQHLESKRV